MWSLSMVHTWHIYTLVSSTHLKFYIYNEDKYIYISLGSLSVSYEIYYLSNRDKSS